MEQQFEAWVEQARIESWVASFTALGTLTERKVYFASEALAIVAIEWAYAHRVAELRKSVITHSVKEYPALDDGSWKLSEIPGKKLVWWERQGDGFVCHKEYFTVDREVLERHIIH